MTAAGGIRTASLRTSIMTFVRTYLAEHDDSPSIGEISVAVRSDKPHVIRALDGLERDGELVRVRGERGKKGRLILPEQQARAVALLRQLGWIVDDDVRSVGPALRRRRRRRSIHFGNSPTPPSSST